MTAQELAGVARKRLTRIGALAARLGSPKYGTYRFTLLCGAAHSRKTDVVLLAV